MVGVGHLAIVMRTVYENAKRHANYQPRPDFSMLAQEVLELSLSLRGRHEHPPEWELVQIGGVVLNWLADIEAANSGSVCDLNVTVREARLEDGRW